MITTTLKDIRKHGPCASGWEKLLRHLGKTKADDEPLLYTVILDSNGIDDAVWCCRVRSDLSSLWRHFAVDCTERRKHLMTDCRSTNALIVARRHALGQATDADLMSARDDALEAAREAAWDAARGAAWEAARDAARGAARGAAWDAAQDAAWAAERKWQSDRFRKLVTDGVWTPVNEEQS